MCDEQTQRLADKLAILEAVAAVAATMDAQDAAGWVNLFTEDAVWEAFRGTDMATPFVRAVGRDGLLAFSAQMQGTNRHCYLGTVFLSLTAETAHAQTPHITVQRRTAEAAPQVIASGTNADEWRKTAAGWRLAHRTIRFD
jgi:hypothetical protein